jgi:hypothetical protein
MNKQDLKQDLKHVSGISTASIALQSPNSAEEKPANRRTDKSLQGIDRCIDDIMDRVEDDEES